MSFESGKTVDELVRIAAAGGGFTVSSTHKTTDELVRIAAAAGGKGSLTVKITKRLTVDELVRISAAGRGSVIFVTET